MSDDQTMSLGHPLGWSSPRQDVTQVGKSPAKRRDQPRKQTRDQAAPREQLTGTPVSSVNQRSKVALKQLSLRIDDGTHSKISQAAQQADKSINAWMEEVLSAAADETLGLGGEGAIHSAAIRYLIEDPVYSRKLIEAIAHCLQDQGFAAIFQFSHPLRKLLVGWDQLKPLLREQPPLGILPSTPSGVVKLTDAILPYLPTADPIAVMQFNGALRQFLLGIAVVKPFMKEDRHESLLEVVAIIESLIQEIETGNA